MSNSGQSEEARAVVPNPESQPQTLEEVLHPLLVWVRVELVLPFDGAYRCGSAAWEAGRGTPDGGAGSQTCGRWCT